MEQLLQKLKAKISATNWTESEKQQYLNALYTRANTALLDEIYQHASPVLKRKLESLSDHFSIAMYAEALGDVAQDAAQTQRLESTYTRILEEELHTFPS